ncbi:MAG: 4Fe-4S binding protein [Chloroflexi bacterium]|nr:4Fe-4S binding protein [Chloroflexota bacterium]
MQIDERKCIRCTACVRACPQLARKAEFRARIFGEIFALVGRKRKDNQVYL